MTPHFIIATRRSADEAQTLRSLRRHGFAGSDWTVLENNTRGLSECYNVILNEHAGRHEILVFLHDDIAIWDILIREKLMHAVNALDYAVVGVAGAETFDFTPWNDIVWWVGVPETKRHGSVEHHLADGRLRVTSYGPTPARCAVIDGVFIAVDMRRIGAVRFDPRFKFHYYDLDFCLAAQAAGLPIGVTNIHLLHDSSGVFGDEAHRAAQAVFLAKHSRQR